MSITVEPARAPTPTTSFSCASGLAWWRVVDGVRGGVGFEGVSVMRWRTGSGVRVREGPEAREENDGG